MYISQPIIFARVCSHIEDFIARKFFRRHCELISKFNVGLKSLLRVQQGLLEPEFYGDLVYKFKKIMVRNDFSDQFRKIKIRHKRIGYNLMSCEVCMLSD